MNAPAPGQLGRPLRNVHEIASSYDAQAWASFITKVENPFFERYGRAVGRVLAELNPISLLDVGCGDGVTLSYALEEVRVPVVFGVDCSRERIRIAESILSERNCTFREMDLFDLKFSDDTFDVVMTSHAIEPNGGREREAVRELLRVARRYVLMLEPDYGAASPEGRERMERLGYVTSLAEAVNQCGYACVLHKPFEEVGNPLNPTGLWLIRKEGNA